MVGEWKEPAVRLTKNWNKLNFPKRKSNSLKTRKTHVRPRPQHRERRKREREKESYVGHKTHENTRIGRRREEMKSLWVTAYKEQTRKQKKNTRNKYGSGRQSFKPQVAEEDWGLTRSQHGRKNTNTQEQHTQEKRGSVGSRRWKPEEAIAVVKRKVIATGLVTEAPREHEGWNPSAWVASGERRECSVRWSLETEEAKTMTRYRRFRRQSHGVKSRWLRTRSKPRCRLHSARSFENVRT
jgi:hypothetical protein